GREDGHASRAGTAGRAARAHRPAPARVAAGGGAAGRFPHRGDRRLLRRADRCRHARYPRRVREGVARLRHARARAARARGRHGHGARQLRSRERPAHRQRARQPAVHRDAPPWRLAREVDRDSCPLRSRSEDRRTRRSRDRLSIRMADARYVVGIDLGTTNCVLAYVDTRDVAPGTESPPLAVLAVPQLTKPGVVEAHAQLPSFIYLPAANEMKPESLALPWGQTEHVVGDLARARGAEVPARVVASAKSWLCSVGVAPARAILPWNAPHDVPRLSPVDAQAAYLRHLRAAWDAAMPAALAE